MSSNRPKLMVLSIDGVPIGLLRRLIEQGDMPHLARLAEQTPIQQMRSVQPTVSCVAWSSYMTGRNPGKHGIYGFIDRRDGGYELMFPNSATMAAENIWETLSRADKRVFGMNVPASYPPRRVNGILIGGFLSPTVDKATYPSSVAGYLKSVDYRLDSDAALARKDKRAMLADLDRTLDARMNAMFHFLAAEPWDFFHTHIMGSDRINHFLWQKAETGDPEFAPAFFAYYRRIDSAIGRLIDQIGTDTPLMIFSDHGFCAIRQEVQLSRYLVEQGWTTPAEKVQHPLSIDPTRSRAYCLIPGRIFVNLKGREPAGIVPPEEYQPVRDSLVRDLLALRDPDNGKPVIDRVLMREDIYWPTGETGPTKPSSPPLAQETATFARAADLIAVPHDGYDLKLGLAGSKLFQKTELEGMHTYDDAFLLARDVDVPRDNLEIMMLARPILQRLGVEPPEDMDGLGAAVTPWNDH